MAPSHARQIQVTDLMVNLAGLGLILYGFCTVLYSAWDLNVTADERIYVEYGLDYLRGDMTRHNTTPPFSRWFGAIGSNLAGLAWLSSEVADKSKSILVAETVFGYRISHVLLYLIGALFIYQVILAKAGAWHALIFSIYVGLDPTLKAFSALNVTDANVAWLLALAGIHLYLYVSPFQSSTRGELVQKTVFVSLACFFFGLAITAKLTALLYGPFIALVILADSAGFLNKKRSGTPRIVPKFSQQVKQSATSVLVGFIFFLFSIWVAYRGDFFFGIANLYQGAAFQVEHNEGGHTAALFQNVRTDGYWYYYLVVLFFKTPLSVLLLLGTVSGSLIYGYVKRMSLKEKSKPYPFENAVLLVFLLPFLWIFIFLSSASVHIGLRYLLVGILLLWVGLALFRSSLGSSPTIPKWAKYGLCGVIAFGISEDITTLRSGAYIAYFNSLAPSPVINFMGSNNDWRQGLPKHLATDYVNYRKFSGYIGDYLSDANDTSQIISGATQLFGVWSPSTNVLLRPFEPIKSVAGYGLYRLDNGDWYRLIENGRTPPKPVHHPETFLKLSQPFSATKQEEQCQRKPITKIVHLANLMNNEYQGKLGNITFSDYVTQNPDLLAAFKSNTKGLDIGPWGKLHWVESGYRESREIIPDESLLQARTLLPGDDIAKLFETGSFVESSEMQELYRVLILGKNSPYEFPKDRFLASVKRLALQLGASDEVISAHQDSLVTSLNSFRDGLDARTPILEFLRKVGIGSVGYVDRLKTAKGFSPTELQSIGHYRLNVPVSGEGTYYILVDLTQIRAKQLGLFHAPSLVAALIDGEISLLGSHEITENISSQIGSVNWGSFVTSKRDITIDIFLQFGGKIRNLALLHQSCG